MNMIANMMPEMDIIKTIKTEMAKATVAWKVIAQAFSDAEEQYGSGSDSFSQILKATRFSKSTAMKLIKVARCKRISNNADMLDRVQAWTVLYEISTLTDSQFDELIDSICDDDVVTSGMVKKCKETEPKQIDQYKPAFQIRIDECALKGGLFSGENYEKLVELIAQIQNDIPHVRVDDAKLYEDNEANYWATLQRIEEQIMHQECRKAIKQYKESSNEWKNRKRYKGAPKPKISSYCSLDDAFTSFKADPKSFFDELEYEYSKSAVWNKARDEHAKRAAKFSERANAQFQYANTVAICESVDDQLTSLSEVINSKRAKPFDAGKFIDFT
nr:hypothetical protein [uncultured Sphingorhabdus sp.]